MTAVVPAAADVDAVLARHDIRLTARIVELGVVRVGLRSNVADFAGYSFFTRFAEPTDPTPVDYWVDCVDLDHVSMDEEELRRLADVTYRGKRFLTGFYLTHYFGERAYLITRGRRLTVFGRGLEKTVWPYFVKHLLTIAAADRGMLHLKSAGFSDAAGDATLLFGRSGAGKTVFLTAACTAGMNFLTNTHIMLDGSTAYGVPSALRVRDDPMFGTLIRRHRMRAHLEQGEFKADPTELFASSADHARVRNLCVVDFQPRVAPFVRELRPEQCLDYLEQFAFPISTYGLKDDLMDHCGGDLDRYLDVYGRMKADLGKLVADSHLFHINADMLDPDTRTAVFAAFAGAPGWQAEVASIGQARR